MLVVEVVIEEGISIKGLETRFAASGAIKGDEGEDGLGRGFSESSEDFFFLL